MQVRCAETGVVLYSRAVTDELFMGSNQMARAASQETAQESAREAAQGHAGEAVREMDDAEVQEWLESLDSVLQASGPEEASYILERLRAHAKVIGIEVPFTANTPYVNTIPRRLQPAFPGNQEIERRIKS